MGDELPEKDFFGKDPFPLWASILAFIMMALAIYAFSAWVGDGVQPDERQIEVTNPSS